MGCPCSPPVSMLMGMERVGSRRISLHRDGRGLLALARPMAIAGADGNVVTVNQIQLWAGQGQALPRATVTEEAFEMESVWEGLGWTLGPVVGISSSQDGIN